MTIRADTVVIGGGVAALWTANRLRSAGYSVVVLSNSPLGDGQSLAAQGVIHGGLKYAVGGRLSDSSEALASMPERWNMARRGEGEADLRNVPVLSDHQIMWSLPGVVSKVVSFFGSKALRGRSGSIPRAEYPEVFNTPDYQGSLFRLEEPVLDPVSIIRELARPLEKVTWLVDWKKNARIIPGPNGIEAIELEGGATLSADTYVFCAGAGNAELLASIDRKHPAMQRRPLHQVVIRKESLPDFYSVCVGKTPKPPIVSTTHIDSAGRKVWYLGGNLAEKEGVDRSESDQIQEAQTWFREHLGWIDLEGADWFTIRIDRAEPDTGTGDRPPGAFCEKEGNVVTAWPTKLALAPDLADKVLEKSGPASGGGAPVDLPLPHPGMGKAPWDLP